MWAALMLSVLQLVNYLLGLLPDWELGELTLSPLLDMVPTVLVFVPGSALAWALGWWLLVSTLVFALVLLRLILKITGMVSPGGFS